MLLHFLILILIIIFIIIFIGLFVKLSFPIENDVKEYSVIKTGDAKNMNLCPIGCSRGACKKIKLNESKSNNYCKYNFQCNYCQDRVTNQFYVHPDVNNEKQILPIYEESKHLVISQKDLLNEAIKKNNDYIIELNNKIRKNNFSS
jgi:hypothetical protein